MFKRPWLARLSIGLMWSSCIIVAVWCCWSLAQTETAIPSTSNVSSNVTRVAARSQILLGQEFVRDNAGSLSFGLSEVATLQKDFLGKPRWQYVASLLYVFLAFAAAKLVDVVFHSGLRRWAKKTKNEWDDVLLGLVNGPVKVVTFVFLANVGLQIFDWPPWLEENLGRLAVVIVGAVLIYLALRMVDVGVGAWKNRLPDSGERAFHEQFIVMVGKLLKVVVIVIGFLTVLPNLGVKITALLGSVSVVGLALGLAAQDTVANLFGALAVFMDKPFQVGDRIQAGGVDGIVEEMGLRAIKVRSLDGYLITVPNKTVGNSTVTNISQRPTIKTEMNLSLPGELNRAQIEETVRIVENVFGPHPRTQDLTITFNKFADSWLNLQVVHLWRGNDGRAQAEDLHELNLTLKSKLDASGIILANPTHTIHLVGQKNLGPTSSRNS